MSSKMEAKGILEPIFALDMSTIRPSHESVLNECMEYAVRRLPDTGLKSLTLSSFPSTFPLYKQILVDLIKKCRQLEHLVINKMQVANPATRESMSELLESILDQW